MAQSPYIVTPRSRQSTYIVKPDEVSADIAPQRPTSISDWTLHDPNGIVQSATLGNPDGWTVQLQGPAAGRDLPGVGATWTSPVLFDALGNRLTTPLNIQDMRVAIQLMERSISFTGSPGHFRVAVGLGDSADPTTAVTAQLFSLDYPDVTPTAERRVGTINCTALNTWAFGGPISTAGQLTCFGVDGSFHPQTTVQVADRTALPLGSNGALILPGTNTNTQPGNLVCNTWTHYYIFVGWDAAGGTAGDSITFAPAIWLFPLTGRG